VCVCVCVCVCVVCLRLSQKFDSVCVDIYPSPYINEKKLDPRKRKRSVPSGSDFVTRCMGAHRRDRGVNFFFVYWVASD
jgi:hypothetical protein